MSHTPRVDVTFKASSLKSRGLKNKMIYLMWASVVQKIPISNFCDMNSHSIMLNKDGNVYLNGSVMVLSS